MKYLNIILFNINSIIELLIIVVSIITTIISIFSFFSSEKNKNIKIIIIICSVSIFILMLYSKNLVMVPNVEGKFYADAKYILINTGLDYENFTDSEQHIVVAQKPKGNLIVNKGSFINLSLDNEKYVEKVMKENKKDILAKLELEEHPFTDIVIQVSELKIKLVDEKYEEYGVVTVPIDSSLVSSIKLKSTDYDIDFTDFTIWEDYNGISLYGKDYVFKNIPLSEYECSLSVDGYLDFNRKITPELCNGTNNFNIVMTSKDMKGLCTYPISIVNSSYEKVDVTNCFINYGVNSNRKENLGYGIQLNEDNRFFIQTESGSYFSLYITIQGGKNYTCNAKVVGADEPYYIVLDNNGTATQTEYADYLNGISR